MKMEQVYGELEVAKSEIEKLKFNLNEKESMIQHLSCTNRKLKADSDSDFLKLEDENNRLLKALNESEGKSKERERALGILQSELDNIKVMLSASQMKCSEAEQEAEALKEASGKENRLSSLEDGYMKLENELKWKKEQFDILVQAHEKMKFEFESSKKEWVLEKSLLVSEIGTAQSEVECQKSNAESLKAELVRCKQALVHEEGRRRDLESRVSEMKTRVSDDECWETDALRDSARKLEKENKVLLRSLRELQDAHIAASTPPSAKIKSKCKVRTVEQKHKDSSLKLKCEFEAGKREWSSLVDEIGTGESGFEFQNSNAESLKAEEGRRRNLESRVSELEKENQELLRSLRELQEAHIPKAASTPNSAVAKIKSKLRAVEQAHKDCSLNLRSKEADWNSQMQMMKRDLEDCEFRLKMKMKEVGDCNATNTELKLQNEELSLMLQLLRTEFSMKQDCDAEQELDLKHEIEELRDALESLNCELTEKVCEGCEIEFELQIWKSRAQMLYAQLEENQRLRRELELSLLAQTEFEQELKQRLGIPEYDDMLQEDEEQISCFVGKARDIRASDERSPFREIN